MINDPEFEYRPDRPTSSKAGFSLWLAFLSIFTSIITGVPAVFLASLALRDIRRAGGKLAGLRLAWAGLILGTFGTLLIPGLIVAAILYARLREEQRAATAVLKAEEDLATCRENLRTIGRAFASYARKHGRYPSNIAGPKSHEGLSWRVAILPELGPNEAALYARFHLDEDWYSPHNRRLLDAMPPVYACPALPELGRSWSCYGQAFAPNSIFVNKYQPESKTGIRPSDVTDGLANTMVVVEARGAIHWTETDGALMRMNMGGAHADNHFHALFADGSVHEFSVLIPPKEYDAMASRAGNDPVPADRMGVIVAPASP